MIILIKKFNPIFFLCICVNCSGPEQSEQEKIRHLNAKGEFIYRQSEEQIFPALETPKHRIREKYPWEGIYSGKFSKISKEFFRCKGSSLNPAHIEQKAGEQPVYYFDCGGAHKHSLPLRDNKEYIYPILIDLLNFLQTKTGKRAVITCGHRCPTHNNYVDLSPSNLSSKHTIGAEVDFYIQDLEERPKEILKLIMSYFKETAPYRGKKEYEEFLTVEKQDPHLSTPALYNKEILIKLYQKNEGRDADNRHPYPYLSLQVRFDRDRNEKVTYSWQKAFNGYQRY